MIRSIGEDVETLDTPYFTEGNIKLHFRKQFALLQDVEQRITI